MVSKNEKEKSKDNQKNIISNSVNTDEENLNDTDEENNNINNDKLNEEILSLDKEI